VLSNGIGFTSEELERSRRYHRPRRLALVADLALGLAVLAVLTRLDLPLRWAVAAAVQPVVVGVVLHAARLPTAWWRYRYDLRWGLSTQPVRGWWLDVLKELAVSVVLLAAGLWPLFALAHWFPNEWIWPAMIGAAALVFVLGFLAPIVLEPVFNRFRPLEDAELARRLHAVAAQAGVPVREILVADASRRTNRSNAYVSGIGRTRRVVLWDTLLRTPADEIAVVLAHELGHRARRHVAILTAIAMAGAAVFIALVRLVRPHPVPRDTALLLLLGLLLQLGSAPALSALSRAFERVADRFSLAVTGDRAAYRSLHHRLAVANLSELEPPKWLYYWFSSHPTAPERLQDA
jgi:STE24 endopeptidase